MVKSAEHIRRYFEECGQPNSVWSPLIPVNSLPWKSAGTSNCLVGHILQNIFLYVQQKKETHTVWEQLEGVRHVNVNDVQNDANTCCDDSMLIFNYPFNLN